MTKQQFLEKLGHELGIDPAKLTADAPLASFGAWDSMGIINTMAFLDEELCYDAPMGALQKCVTVGDLEALVSNKLAL